MWQKKCHNKCCWSLLFIQPSGLCYFTWLHMAVLASLWISNCPVHLVSIPLAGRVSWWLPSRDPSWLFGGGPRSPPVPSSGAHLQPPAHQEEDFFHRRAYPGQSPPAQAAVCCSGAAAGQVLHHIPSPPHMISSWPCICLSQALANTPVVSLFRDMALVLIADLQITITSTCTIVLIRSTQ